MIDDASSGIETPLIAVDLPVFPSVTIPFTAGRLALGTWQQIVILDFDTRSRVRDLIVQVIGE